MAKKRKSKEPSIGSEISKGFIDFLDRAKSVGGMVTRAASYFASRFSPDDKAVFQKKYRASGNKIENRRVSGSQYIAAADREQKFADIKKNVHVGGLYVYKYLPKWKDELPYWDHFPLLFLIDVGTSKKGTPYFMGLNLHYIAPRQRAILMDAIRNKMKTDGMDPNDMDEEKSTTRRARNISYSTLKKASGIALFKPCVKMYLPTHVVSTYFVKVPYKEWQEVLFLPLQKFEKKSAQYVWRESTRKR